MEREQWAEMLRAVQNHIQRQTTHAKQTSDDDLHPPCLQIDSSLTGLTSCYRASSKLETEPRAITNYLSLNASLMQAVEESNGGKDVARRQKMLWIEESRGE